jgi:exopolysaccharide biosynthesis polyprenyl glycosylphosphotransferase
MAPDESPPPRETPTTPYYIPTPAGPKTGVDTQMGIPKVIESVGGVDRLLAGPVAAMGRIPFLSPLAKLLKSEEAAQAKAPWVVYANGGVNGLVADLRAADLLDSDSSVVILRNGDLSARTSDRFADSPVVVARPDLPCDELMAVCRQLMDKGRHVWALSPALEVFRGRARMREVDGVPLVRLGRAGRMKTQGAAKRILDILGASAALIFLSPFLLLLSLLIKLTSKGPVLFKQWRNGQNGKPFVCFKFRSMRVNSDQSIHRRYWDGFHDRNLEGGVDKSGQRVYKLTDDPRVTKLGRLLRRTSLDELPQLLNVLQGQMSLVGPRPCLVYEWDSYKEWQKQRLAVTAGITGLWQVTGRSKVTFDEMALLDIFYGANWSLGMDFKLMLRTIPAVFNGRGAH